MIATLRNTPSVTSSFNRRAIGPRAELPERSQAVPCCSSPASGLRSSASSRRRGISLLEVLIAVFVLTFGLMSVAMVIPAGRALMVEAAKNDRGSACGRAALNDVQVRRWYDSSNWIQKWGAAGVLMGPAWIQNPPYSGTISMPNAVDDRGLLYGEAYFIDPYFYDYDTNEDKDSVRDFPYIAYPDRELVFAGGTPRQWPDRALARRITFLRNYPPSVTPPPYLPLQEAFAARLTTWADELIFSIESDDRRPRQLYTTTDGERWAFPTLPGDKMTAGATRLGAADEGRFTWAAMIIPVMPYMGPASTNGTYHGTWTLPSGLVLPLIDPDLISQYEVSIVVFYSRNHYCPEGSGDTTIDELQNVTDIETVRERSVYARLDGSGIAGGDVTLFVPDGDGARPTGYLNVKKNQWIMLKGLDRAREVNGGGTVVPTRQTVCKWYRIVSVDDVEYGVEFRNPEDLFGTPLQGRSRMVTLAGPDWQVDTTYNTATSNTPPFDSATDIAEAAIVDDVVGVYTTIIDVNAL